MAKKPKLDDVYISPLVKHPEHVMAIGMISVELANLDGHFSTLLAMLLNVEPKIGQQLYFAPRAATVRIEMVSQVADGLSRRNPAAAKKVKSLTKRARNIVDKRHKYIHDAWGVTSDGKVVRASLPTWRAKKKHLVPLSELNTVVNDIRMLVKEIRESFIDLHSAFWCEP